MSMIKPDQLAETVKRTLQEFQGVTEEAVAKGVVECANSAVDELRSAHPPGSEKYGSWDRYNASWKRSKLKNTKKGGYSEVIHNEKHYQLAHLLEKGHAVRGGGRARAFPHIAPVAEKAEEKLLEMIRKNIGQ